MPERTQKLVSIRHRTDQDLLVIVSRELDRGVTLAGMATTRNSPSFAQAEKAHATAMTFLSKIAGLSDGDRLEIESGLSELTIKLEQVPVYANVRSYPASIAS